MNPDPSFRIQIYSHFFKVIPISPKIIPIVVKFAMRFQMIGWIRNKNGKKIKAPVRVFAARTATHSEYRFHINVWDDFLKYLKETGVHPDSYVEEIMPLPKAMPLGIAMKDGFVPRDYQIPVGEYLNPPPETNRARFVDLQTGKGKGIVSMFALAHHNMRVAIIVRPKFIEKWGLELAEKMKINVHQIMTIQGSAELKGLIEMCQEGRYDFPICIISNKTMQNWLKDYESRPLTTTSVYGCRPDELMGLLGVGIKLVDEVHLDFHLNFKIDLYTHVEMSIALSATLLNDEWFLEDMYKLMFPPSTRYQGSKLDRYVNAFAFMYNLNPNTKVNTKEWGSSTYSHHAFEKSILKNRDLTRRYFEMVDHVLNVGYFDDYERNEKGIIFVSGIIMATELSKWLALRYRNFSITRYVEDDPYENLIESDIRVSTIQSAGTGHDIPDLKTTLLTNAVNSTQSNIQTLGRLRKRPDNKPTRFYYFSCLDIAKHMAYHENKKKMLLSRAATFKEIFYQHNL